MNVRNCSTSLVTADGGANATKASQHAQASGDTPQAQGEVFQEFSFSLEFRCLGAVLAGGVPSEDCGSDQPCEVKA